jgi:hypothetical protein
MPDLNKAIANHNRTMAQWWKRKEYIAARKEFCKKHPVCVRCGRKTQTPGHIYEDYLHGYDHYLLMVTDGICDPLCNACNLAEKRGLKPCPFCVKEEGRKIRYIQPSSEYCFDHIPENDKIRRQERKEAFKWLVKQSHSIQNAKRRAVYQSIKEKRKQNAN